MYGISILNEHFSSNINHLHMDLKAKTLSSEVSEQKVQMHPRSLISPFVICFLEKYHI